MNFSTNDLNYRVRWNIKREPVYRLLDNLEHLENFFQSGQIMISCFETFKKNPDEMRGDPREGNAMVSEFGNGDYNTHIIYDGGQNAYILSTTSLLSKNVINDFNALGAIRINDPMFFGLEICKKLPFINSGIEGKCNYQDSRVRIMDGDAGKFINSLTAEDVRRQLVVEELAQLTLGEEIFVKGRKYEHQQEYRFVWFSNAPVKQSYLINCPEAMQFCDKIIF